MLSNISLSAFFCSLGSTAWLNLSRDSLCVQTFNDFFIRELKPGVRPIAYEDIDSVAVSAADSRLMAFNSPDDATRFWIKVPVSFSYLRFHLWLTYIGAHVIVDSCRGGYLLLIPRNTTHEKTVMWSLAEGLEFTFGLEITRALSAYFLPLGAFSTCGISNSDMLYWACNGVVVFFLLLCKRIVGDRTSALGWAHELILTSYNWVLQGRKFSVTGLLGEQIAKDFEGGPMVIYRLAPQVSSTLWFSQICSMFLFPLVSWVLSMRLPI